MPRDSDRLDHLLAAADVIAGYLTGVDRERFSRECLLQDAVLRRLLVIGEAASRLSEAFRNQHPEVPWRRIIAPIRFALRAAM